MKSMTTKLAAAGVAGVLSLTGLAIAAPLASATTVSQDGATATTVGDRLQAIRDALAGLVTDGTITQAQADEVAATLDESDALRGPGGGHGRGAVDLDAAATALGITAEELRTALAVEGTTLADVAAAEGVDTSALVDALVSAGTERLAQAVEDGRLTRAEADERLAALPGRVAALVEEEVRFGGHGRGPRGGPADGATDGATDDRATDDSAAGA